MIHTIAQGKKYNCFVKKETRLPFIVMPDAINAIINLMNAHKAKLSHHVYNISAFNPSVEEFSIKIKKYFPKAKVGYSINQKRQKLVESWPAAIDDSAARSNWGWSPKFDLSSALSDYLIPNIKKKYNK